jgi:glycosyltransferase involved in cell wall biosynthesis
MADDGRSRAEDRTSGPHPLVSIGVPVLNGGPLLEVALGDLRAQTWPNLEIVVSDNASTDGTRAVLERACAEDLRIRTHRHERTVPPQDNFADVFERSNGEFFLWAAHDDRWPVDYVERLVGRLRADPTAVLAAGLPQVIDGTGTVLVTYPKVARLAAADRTARLRQYIAEPEPDGKANLIYGVFRRDALADIEPRRFWERDRRRIDYHIVFASLARGAVVVDTDVPFFKRRGVPAARTWWTPLASVARVYGWLDAYLAMIDELGLPARERAELRAAVRRRKFEIPGNRLRALWDRPTRW